MQLKWNQIHIDGIFDCLLDVEKLAVQCKIKLETLVPKKVDGKKKLVSKTTFNKKRIMHGAGFKSTTEFNKVFKRAQEKIKKFLDTRYGIKGVEDLPLDIETEIIIPKIKIEHTNKISGRVYNPEYHHDYYIKHREHLRELGKSYYKKKKMQKVPK
jgi:hypothetical protein